MEKETKYQDIIQALREMFAVDQKMRERAEKEPDFWDYAIDAANTERLKEIVSRIGWPSVSLVGKEASHQAWLLVQHADKDLAFQEECLRAMLALPEGEVSKHNIAYLTDRIRMNKKVPQLYGTQYLLDQETGLYAPLPIESPERVEDRRKEMGLDTLEENTKRINNR